MTNKTDKNSKILSGKVVSDKMQETCVVVIGSYKKHARFGKYMSSRKKIKAHNPKNEAKTGDLVDIIPCAPISKDKHFRILSIKSSNLLSKELVN